MPATVKEGVSFASQVSSIILALAIIPFGILLGKIADMDQVEENRNVTTELLIVDARILGMLEAINARLDKLEDTEHKHEGIP